MCSFTKKLQLLGDEVPDPMPGLRHWTPLGFQTPSILLYPPNNPVRSTPLILCIVGLRSVMPLINEDWLIVVYSRMSIRCAGFYFSFYCAFYTFVTIISPFELMLCILLLLIAKFLVCCFSYGGVCPPLIKSLLTYLPYWTRRQKSAYSTEYLNNYWTYRHQTFSISSHVYGDYKTDRNFAVAQWTLLW